MMKLRIALILGSILWTWVAPGRAQLPLTKLENCSYVPADWADGDSFPVRTAEGTEFTLRLYGADCLEWHVTDDSDGRRLRAQRRYFGISTKGGDPQASIELAKGFGQVAGERAAVLMQEPFTVFTAHADARGDGRFQRVYGFVRLADGRDLASVLVEEGLARAFGVCRETPDRESHEEYRELLGDLELQAAKMGRGIWENTDWATLPDERREQRLDDAELDMSSDKAKAMEGFLLDPNSAARDDLLKLPGVGEVIANRIIEARPFQSVDDLLRVPGIGKTTLEKIKLYLEFQKSPR